MEEIKVGDYARLTSGIIDKIIEIQTVSTKIDGNHLYAFRLENYPHVWREYFQIVKHSKNIIDLIEVGDYVNGYLVRKINGELCNFDLNTMEWRPLKNIDIFESLVTKQQFESIEYKI